VSIDQCWASEPAVDQVQVKPDASTRSAAADPVFSAPAAAHSISAPPDDGLQWLMGLLRQTMTEAVTSDMTPLQKANAVARLGALYLKAHGTTELERANKELKRHAAELEERVAELEKSLAVCTPAGAERSRGIAPDDAGRELRDPTEPAEARDRRLVATCQEFPSQCPEPDRPFAVSRT